LLKIVELLDGGHLTCYNKFICRADFDKYYNFTELACQLNEMEDGVAPTDTRNRPDQRLMEDGRWDEANLEKVRLEEKQRASRRQRESEAEKAAADGTYILNYMDLLLFSDLTRMCLLCRRSFPTV